MSKDTIPQWDVVPGNNTDVGGVNIAELFPAANINNAMRQMMAETKAYLANVDTLASATSIDLGAAVGNFVTITGTTTITALGTVAAGTWKDVTFSGSLSMTYNATTLILPGAVDLVVSAGDTARFISLGSGNWMCFQYTPAAAAFTAAKAGVNQTIASSTSTKLTFTTEFLDAGGYYDAPNSRWTPPAGLYLISAQALFISGLVDQFVAITSIFRNGSLLAESKIRLSGGGTADQSAQIQYITQASGTDFYEVFAFSDGTGNKTISGVGAETFFQGVRLA